MGDVNAQHGNRTSGPTRVMVQVWHPDCWTLKVTDATQAGLVAHGVYEIEGRVNARVTAYADRTSHIESLIEAMRESDLVDSVECIHDHFSPYATQAVGNATEELLVKYDPRNSIHEAFISRGFVPDEPINIKDGYEYWTVVTGAPRSKIHQRLEQIMQEEGADITVQLMTSVSGSSQAHLASSREAMLSERQREVFNLARQHGYYTWPRETSAGELADELDISKTTLLEHLRKAEAKLLGE